jgi:16S rRNA (cytidine1402-2'-O)-methyltransferase
VSGERTQTGVLYVVATPIGNLGDLSTRAADTLRSTHRIAAEDTRRTRGLLSHLGITGKPVDRLDAHASEGDVARCIERLLAGEDVALVTDAGTPVVSDPGTALVQAASRAGVRVVPIPGPSAVMAAVSAAGLVTGGFRFLGFLPRGGPERRTALETVRATPESVVLFEAPQRAAETLADLARVVPGREAVVGRELTKVHEEFLRGTLAELAEAASAREILGEVTIVIGPGGEQQAATLDDAEIDRRVDALLAAGRRPRDIADELALEAGRPRRELYARVLARKGAR